MKSPTYDGRFERIETAPENKVFQIVFYPDRIYHAQYLNATRSSRYRYYVHEVRNKLDITALKGQVHLDGRKLCNFLRMEYRAGRLVEQVREKGRFLRGDLLAKIRLLPKNSANTAEAVVKMHYCPWIDAFQVEMWETLEAPPTKWHDVQVQSMMGLGSSITRVRQFALALADINDLKEIEVSFRENDIDFPFGYKIKNEAWDKDYFRTYQAPNSPDPNSPQNTVEVGSYLLNFRRGWFLHSEDVPPVRYENGLVAKFSETRERDPNPDYRKPGVPPPNIIEMRWILQRELGSSLVYFHEVTIPPGCIEGTHRHIGSEELYYIYEGEGIAYMGEGDDPNLSDDAKFPIKMTEIFAIGPGNVRELRVRPGSVIYTKSGGIHGIRNPNAKPLKFVAFGYHGA